MFRDQRRFNIRQARAQALAHAIFREIQAPLRELRDTGDDRAIDDVMRCIERFLRDEGVEVLSDMDRQALDLPARGPDGWTPDEVIAMEARRLEILNKPLTMTVWPPRENEGGS